MDFNEYQKLALRTDVSGRGSVDHGPKDLAFLEQLLGLVGEAGEFADKIKKILRDQDGDMTEVQKEECIKELGDVLWYLAILSRYMGTDFQEVAEKNIAKLADRASRGKIGSEGDNR